jgi:hypothetical protein
MIRLQQVGRMTNPLTVTKQSCHSYKHEPCDIFHFHVERRDQSFAVTERAER